MKQRICQIFPIFFILLLSSCEMSKEVDYSTTYTPSLIAHGYISPQDSVLVIVKKAISPDDLNAVDTVCNAQVFLCKNDKEYLRLKQSTTYNYICDSLDFIDDSSQYSIMIKHDKLGTVVSTNQTILTPPNIDSSKVIEKGNRIYVLLSFNNDYIDQPTLCTKTTYYKDGEVDLSWDIYGEFISFSILDNLKKGENTMNIGPYYTRDFDSLKLELCVVSDDFSIFLESLDNYEFSREDPFYPQTYPVYSNMNGGYGVFASYNYNSIVITNPENNEE